MKPWFSHLLQHPARKQRAYLLTPELSHEVTCVMTCLQGQMFARTCCCEVWAVGRFDFLLPRNWILANECWGSQWCKLRSKIL